MTRDITVSPEHRKTVAAWLFTVAAMVAMMIVIGGFTRLTESGLSMVDWRPVTGWLPPLDDAEWDRVFARYRAYPEYQKRNLGMTLAEFKSIYWLEYVHRLWGRIIGIAFLVPLVVFIAKGWIGRGLAPQLIGLFVLGAAQGVLGWAMVKSGMVSRPDVSQYRLAAHLALAMAILAYLLWTGLALARAPGPEPGRAARRLGRWAAGLAVLIFATVISGAFVAGLDAGRIYNTFPLMDGKWVPDGLLAMSPAYVNAFENVATVQFDHRLLAVTTLAAVLGFWSRARAAPLTTRGRRALATLVAVVVVQVALGISTLLLVVPVGLAVLHQAGAVALLAAAVWLVHELRAGAAGE